MSKLDPPLDIDWTNPKRPVLRGAPPVIGKVTTIAKRRCREVAIAAGNARARREWERVQGQIGQKGSR